MSNKQKHFLGINTSLVQYPRKESRLDEVSPDSYKSLLDYDGIVISTKLDLHGKTAWQTILNENVVYKEYALRILYAYEKIKRQIIELLKQGKNIYVILNADSNLYYELGRKSVSFDLYSFLPFSIDIEYLRGNNIDIRNDTKYSDFLIKTKLLYEYKAVVNYPNATKLATINGSKKDIAIAIPIEKGNIVLLPSLVYSNDNTAFLDALFALDDKLSNNSDEYILPEWTESFFILDEKNQIEMINKKNQQLELLKKNIAEDMNALSNLKAYKGLLCSSGKHLESLVKKLLVELGFSLLETEENRDDIIACYKSRELVVEIKGVKKSAAEKHTAQLEKWASLFYEKNGREPKAMLIVNGYSEIPVFSRGEDIFPNQMLDYCIKKGICLVSTIQLLCLFIDLKNDSENIDEKINDLLNTSGIYSRYKDIEKYLVPRNNLSPDKR